MIYERCGFWRYTTIQVFCLADHGITLKAEFRLKIAEFRLKIFTFLIYIGNWTLLDRSQAKTNYHKLYWDLGLSQNEIDERNIFFPVSIIVIVLNSHYLLI